MKQNFIRYTEHWQPGPMSFWVHKEVDGRPWYKAEGFEPGLPGVVPGKGYPRFYVEFDDFVFEFASLQELDACTATLSQKHLPSTDRETQEKHTGPGAHWLNKLPGWTKSWRYRSRALKYLTEARESFERELADSTR